MAACSWRELGSGPTDSGLRAAGRVCDWLCRTADHKRSAGRGQKRVQRQAACELMQVAARGLGATPMVLIADRKPPNFASERVTRPFSSPSARSNLPLPPARRHASAAIITSMRVSPQLVNHPRCQQRTSTPCRPLPHMPALVPVERGFAARSRVTAGKVFVWHARM